MDQFLNHPIDSENELIEAYTVGHRLVKFLSSILPTHDDYFSEDIDEAEARSRSIEQLDAVLKYLDQIAILIDKQAHEDYIRSVLTEESDAVDIIGVGPKSHVIPDDDGYVNEPYETIESPDWNETTKIDNATVAVPDFANHFKKMDRNSQPRLTDLGIISESVDVILVESDTSFQSARGGGHAAPKNNVVLRVHSDLRPAQRKNDGCPTRKDVSLMSNYPVNKSSQKGSESPPSIVASFSNVQTATADHGLNATETRQEFLTPHAYRFEIPEGCDKHITPNLLQSDDELTQQDSSTSGGDSGVRGKVKAWPPKPDPPDKFSNPMDLSIASGESRIRRVDRGSTSFYSVESNPSSSSVSSVEPVNVRRERPSSPLPLEQHVIAKTSPDTMRPLLRKENDSSLMLRQFRPLTPPPDATSDMEKDPIGSLRLNWVDNQDIRKETRMRNRSGFSSSSCSSVDEEVQDCEVDQNDHAGHCFSSDRVEAHTHGRTNGPVLENSDLSNTNDWRISETAFRLKEDAFRGKENSTSKLAVVDTTARKKDFISSNLNGTTDSNGFLNVTERVIRQNDTVSPFIENVSTSARVIASEGSMTLTDLSATIAARETRERPYRNKSRRQMSVIPSFTEQPGSGHSQSQLVDTKRASDVDVKNINEPVKRSLESERAEVPVTRSSDISEGKPEVELPLSNFPNVNEVSLSSSYAPSVADWNLDSGDEGNILQPTVDIMGFPVSTMDNQSRHPKPSAVKINSSFEMASVAKVDSFCNKLHPEWPGTWTNSKTDSAMQDHSFEMTANRLSQDSMIQFWASKGQYPVVNETTVHHRPVDDTSAKADAVPQVLSNERTVSSTSRSSSSQDFPLLDCSTPYPQYSNDLLDSFHLREELSPNMGESFRKKADDATEKPASIPRVEASSQLVLDINSNFVDKEDNYTMRKMRDGDGRRGNKLLCRKDKDHDDYRFPNELDSLEVTNLLDSQRQTSRAYHFKGCVRFLLE